MSEKKPKEEKEFEGVVKRLLETPPWPKKKEAGKSAKKKRGKS